MSTLQSINDFINQKQIAVAGVSRNEQKFGNTAYKELLKKGYKVYPVNTHMETYRGEMCYPNISALPDDVQGVIIVTDPNNTISIIKEGEARGIRNFWIQQGAESNEAMEFANHSDSNIIFKECILMFAEPVVSVHKFHRFFKKLFGKYPK